MAKVLVTEDYLKDIADAIRGKNGLTRKYTPSEMSEAILGLPGELHIPINIEFSNSDSSHQTVSVDSSFFPETVTSSTYTSDFIITYPNSVRLHSSVTPGHGYLAGTLDYVNVNADWGDTKTFSVSEAVALTSPVFSYQVISTNNVDFGDTVSIKYVFTGPSLQTVYTDGSNTTITVQELSSNEVYEYTRNYVVTEADILQGYIDFSLTNNTFGGSEVVEITTSQKRSSVSFSVYGDGSATNAQFIVTNTGNNTLHSLNINNSLNYNTWYVYELGPGNSSEVFNFGDISSNFDIEYVTVYLTAYTSGTDSTNISYSANLEYSGFAVSNPEISLSYSPITNKLKIVNTGNRILYSSGFRCSAINNGSTTSGNYTLSTLGVGASPEIPLSSMVTIKNYDASLSQTSDSVTIEFTSYLEPVMEGPYNKTETFYLPHIVNLENYSRDNITNNSSYLSASNVNQLTNIVAGSSANHAISNNCSNLISLNNLEKTWYMDNVTSMDGMFDHCQSLTSLDVSNWNVSNVTGMGHLFSHCESIVSLDLSKWNTSSVTNMNGMFNGCSNLTILDISGFTTQHLLTVNQNSVDFSNMFNGCNNLQYLIIDSNEFKFALKSNSNFGLNTITDCKILVPYDLIETYKSATRWDSVSQKFEPIENYIVTRSNGQVFVEERDFGSLNPELSISYVPALNLVSVENTGDMRMTDVIVRCSVTGDSYEFDSIDIPDDNTEIFDTAFSLSSIPSGTSSITISVDALNRDLEQQVPIYTISETFSINSEQNLQLGVSASGNVSNPLITITNIGEYNITDIEISIKETSESFSYSDTVLGPGESYNCTPDLDGNSTVTVGVIAGSSHPGYATTILIKKITFSN